MTPDEEMPCGRRASRIAPFALSLGLHALAAAVMIYALDARFQERPAVVLSLKLVAGKASALQASPKERAGAENAARKDGPQTEAPQGEVSRIEVSRKEVPQREARRKEEKRKEASGKAKPQKEKPKKAAMKKQPSTRESASGAQQDDSEKAPRRGERGASPLASHVGGASGAGFGGRAGGGFSGKAAPAKSGEGEFHGAAEATSSPRPAYPELARRRGQEGTVRVRCEVNASGAVAAVSLAASSGFRLLDEAALKGVAKWKFRPGGGVVIVPVRFALR